MDLLLAVTVAISGLALLASAFFSAAELAIFSFRPKALEALRKHQGPKAGWIAEMLAQPRRYFVTLLLGNVLANVILACGLVFVCYQRCPQPWRTADWVPVTATAGLVILFGELIPKAIASCKPVPVALGTVGWLRMLERMGRPFITHMDRLSQNWVARLTPSSVRPLRGLTDEEYVTMLDIGTREGALRPSERRLIEQTLQLADRNLRELMTPRSEMCQLDAEMELEEMKKAAAAMRHRRLPIYSETPDAIVGVLNVRRFLLEADGDLMVCIEPPSFVPETMSALELMKNFMRRSQHMALVVDEFGGVEGLVTLEDLVEEVFGEIYDEYDPAVPPWEQVESGVYLVQGSAHLPMLSELLGVELEADGIDTLGGWLTDRLGALPRAGDRYTYMGYYFQVEKMNRLRVGTVLVRDERRRRR